ncbi:hypothetical protein XENOCAPTIV_025746 [Xenoophorus captivus]|uniref:Uncharacterized protein n=1 Tax=Xenoophorus captivus TaxID=1517983 RepID=A0ABV0QCK6_9TELE
MCYWFAEESGWNNEEGGEPPTSSTSFEIQQWMVETWTQLGVPKGQRSQTHLKTGFARLTVRFWNGCLNRQTLAVLNICELCLKAGSVPGNQPVSFNITSSSNESPGRIDCYKMFVVKVQLNQMYCTRVYIKGDMHNLVKKKTH